MGCVDWNTIPRTTSSICLSRSLHGLRGLKSRETIKGSNWCSRSLHGLRGLKLWTWLRNHQSAESQPAWAAWIEISSISTLSMYRNVAACMGCVDWNFLLWYGFHSVLTSQPAWAAWIEISKISGTISAKESRSLYGLCGLKHIRSERSRLVRGVWVEIHLR